MKKILFVACAITSISHSMQKTEHLHVSLKFHNSKQLERAIAFVGSEFRQEYYDGATWDLSYEFVLKIKIDELAKKLRDQEWFKVAREGSVKEYSDKCQIEVPVENADE